MPPTDDTHYAELEAQLHALAAQEKSVLMNDGQTARLRAAMQEGYRRTWYKRTSRVAALLTLLGVASIFIRQWEEGNAQYQAPAPMTMEYAPAPAPAKGCTEPTTDVRNAWGEMECEAEEMFDCLDDEPLLVTNGSMKITSVAQNSPAVVETGMAKRKAARKRLSPPQQLVRLLVQPEPDLAAIRALLENQRSICILTTEGDITITLADDQSISITGSNAPAHTLRNPGDSLPEGLRTLLLSYLSTDTS